MLREIPFGTDGNYTTELFLNRINTDLANNYGNLVSRTFSMLKKYRGSVVPKAHEITEDIDIDLIEAVKNGAKECRNYIESNFDVSKALGSIFDIFSKANKYIEVTEPYRLAKDETKSDRLDTVLRILLETIRVGTILFSAFLPDVSKTVLDAMSVSDYSYEDVENIFALSEGMEISQLGILFPRLDIEKELEELAKINAELEGK